MHSLLLLVQFGLACKKPVEPTPIIEVPIAVVEKVEIVAALPAQVLTLSKNFQKVFFDLDKSMLGTEAQTALSDNATILQEFTDVRVEIQGHADERGTTEYNIALGQRRAKAVSDYLLSQGIAPSRLKVVSYGEEKPLTAGDNEVAFSKNRRCEFIIVWGGEQDVKGSDQEGSEEGGSEEEGSEQEGSEQEGSE